MDEKYRRDSVAYTKEYSMRLFYLPLEPYIERYTWFMSSVDGWAENNFNKYNIPFTRIEGQKLDSKITAGVVLDCYGRSHYAMTQLCTLIEKIKSGEVKNGDIVYTEDFWHPGIESLFYIRSITGIKFKIGTFLHAQSVDKWDFTYPMSTWIRDIEKGFSKGYDFIFVTSKILQDLCIKAGFKNIHLVGLPYNSERLKEQLKDIGLQTHKKESYVLFSSRFDIEKNPHFFLDIVEECKGIKFKLVKPREVISNDKDVIKRLDKVLSTCSNLELIDTSKNKLDYYNLLSKAEIQFNCARQDWVSWTLLEAITFKCKPLYPIWRDFPVELKGYNQYLYKNESLKDAINKLYKLLRLDFNKEVNAVVVKHDNSWKKYLEIMGVL